MTLSVAAVAEEDSAQDDEKKVLTYTEKKKKKKSSSDSDSSGQSQSELSPAQEEFALAILGFLVTPWMNCDVIVEGSSEEEKKSSLFYGCTEEGNNERMAAATIEKDLLFEVGYGINSSSWEPGAAETEVESGVGAASLLKFDTEGLTLQKIDLQMSYLGRPLLTYSDERPYESTDSQNALMELRQSDVASDYTKYTYGIQLMPLMEMLKVDYNIVNFLFSYRYEEQYEAFLGKATALGDMEYLSKDAVIQRNPTTQEVTIESGAVSIAKGDSVSFKSLFSDKSHSIELTQLWGPTLWTFYIGMFESEWERPSDNKRAVKINDKPVIFDTTFRTSGGFVEFGPRFPAGDGFKMSFRFKAGSDNDVENAALDPLGINFYEDFEKLEYSETDFKVWWNILTRPRFINNDELLISLGYQYNSRVWGFSVKYEDGTSDFNEADKDVIQKYYAQLRYRF